MIKGFKMSEKALRLIETDNTLVLVFNREDKKDQIKKQVESHFKIKVEGISTHIKDNKKFAYVKLNKKNPAIDIATKYGLI